MKRLLTAAILLGLALQARPAMAQGMDMSWAIQSQYQNQMTANAYAQAAAMEWLRQVWNYRMATGYTGPIQAPVNLSSAAQGMNQAFDSYLEGLQASSARTDRVASNYSNHAILNQGGYLNPYTGEVYTLPDGYTHVWQGVDGSIVATPTWTPPTYANPWTYMVPVW